MAFSCAHDVDFSTPPKILSFSIDEIPESSAQIIESQVILSVPYGTNVRSLTPKIGLEASVKLIPASGVAQDFSKNVYYTLTGPSGSKSVYKVRLKVAAQPIPMITSIKNDTIEAGLETKLLGLNFGTFPFAIKTYVQNSKLEIKEVPFSYLDSASLVLKIPITTQVGPYFIKVKVNELEAISPKSVYISYPTPQIKTLSHKNMVNNDTLWVAADYVDSSYIYSAVFKNDRDLHAISKPFRKTGSLGFIPQNLVGDYEVYLKNISENKISKSSEFSIEIFDANKPYIRGIKTGQTKFKRGEELVLTTKNFEKSEARFYQIILKNSQKKYIQNGRYSNEILSIILPENTIKGKYTVSVLLTNPQNNYNYSIETDFEIEVVD